MQSKPGLSRARAQAAVDALRAGVVNRFIAEHLTYGRGGEVRRIEHVIRQNPHGSTAVVVGGYGVGKSHLCEVLRHRLEARGYVVARMEMGASHGRADNPRGVANAIAQALSVRINGRAFSGRDELRLLAHALRKPDSKGLDRIFKDFEVRKASHEDHPGFRNAPLRYDQLRAFHQISRANDEHVYIPPLMGTVPSSMTAVNCAVREVNGVAHSFADQGFKGLVLLFDEAERSEWAPSYYRTERARNLMLGFALASANMSTAHLKHYRNELSHGYLKRSPSRLHSVFFFTRWWGMASDLAGEAGAPIAELPPLTTAARHRLRDRIVRLYQFAYRVRAELDERSLRVISDLEDREDVRSMVRATVGALDSKMWRREVRRSNGRHP